VHGGEAGIDCVDRRGTVVTRWYFSRVRARTSSRRVIYRRSVLVYLWLIAECGSDTSFRTLGLWGSVIRGFSSPSRDFQGISRTI
jgi:hypothetical protein